MAVLYRKYRPQTFLEVLNQKFIIQTLKNQVQSGKISHAYLFTGSRGVGKTSVARILAKAVNCKTANQLVSQSADQNLNGDACGECEVCKQIEAGNFLDLVEIDAASNTGVDNIRDLIEHVRFSPSLGKYKVFIIDEVHMLSKGAFNALLKTLEEPPAHAIFILATTEINKVPSTIISRTQRFDFKAYSPQDLMPLLEKITKQEGINFSKPILELVAQNAEGSARDALSLLDKVMTLGEGASLQDFQQILGITDITTCENLLEMVALGQAQNIPLFFASCSERGMDYSIFNRDFLEFLRKVLVYKITEGKTDFGFTKEHEDKIKNLAEKFSAADLIFIIRLFLKSYKDLSFSSEEQIPLLIASVEAALRKAENKKTPRMVEAEAVKTEAFKSEPPTVESKMVEKLEQAAEVQTATVLAEEQAMELPEARILWPKIIVKVKEVNGPLASLLKNTNLLDIEGNRFVLGVKFAFDKQSLESPKNTSLICSVIEELSSKKMSILAQVIKQESVGNMNPAETIGEALKVFGGELVE